MINVESKDVVLDDTTIILSDYLLLILARATTAWEQDSCTPYVVMSWGTLRDAGNSMLALFRYN